MEQIHEENFHNLIEESELKRTKYRDTSNTNKMDKNYVDDFDNEDFIDYNNNDIQSETNVKELLREKTNNENDICNNLQERVPNNKEEYILLGSPHRNKEAIVIDNRVLVEIENNRDINHINSQTIEGNKDFEDNNNNEIIRNTNNEILEFNNNLAFSQIKMTEKTSNNSNINNSNNQHCHTFNNNVNTDTHESNNNHNYKENKTTRISNNYSGANFSLNNNNFSKTNRTNNTYAYKDHLLVKIKRNDLAVQSLMQKHKELAVSNYNLSNVFNRESNTDFSLKEKINAINKEIEEIKIENEAMLFAKFNEQIERQNLEISQKKITDYCNDMKNKSLNVEHTYQDYEQLVNDKKEELQAIKEEYDFHIKKCENENSLIQKTNSSLEDKSEHLKNRARELEIKIDLVKKETEEDKAMYMERDLLNRIKFEELERKYSELQKKAFTMQQEKQKKNKNKNIINSENKSYRLKKIRKIHLLEKGNIMGNYEKANQDNVHIKSEINNKKAYLKDLLSNLKKLSELQNKEPGYLKPKSVPKN